jgi:hypothetical protein
VRAAKIYASAWRWATYKSKSAERQDLLRLIDAFAMVLLTLLGAAGEAPGYDRMAACCTF